MQVTVRVPGSLRSLTCGERELVVRAHTVRGAIDAIERLYPGIRDQLLDAQGVRRFVNIFLGEKDIRFLDGLETRLEDGDELDLVPALAGG
jgi:molybdopterin synthase sulfur carrier subunit